MTAQTERPGHYLLLIFGIMDLVKWAKPLKNRKFRKLSFPLWNRQEVGSRCGLCAQ